MVAQPGNSKAYVVTGGPSHIGAAGHLVGHRPPEPGFCSLQLELYFVMVFKFFKSCSIFLGRFMLVFTHYNFLKM